MSRPLRIGIVTDSLEERQRNGAVEIGNGGVGVYIYQLVRHLRAIDPVNDYVLMRSAPGRLDLYSGIPSVFTGTSRCTHYARWLGLPYIRVAAELRLDIVHFPDQFACLFLPPRVKRVLTVHDITPILFPQHHPWQRVLGYRLMLRWSTRRAHQIIVDSSHTGNDLLARRLVSPSRLSVVPLGVDERFTPHTEAPLNGERYDLPERFILSVGVLEPRKNHTRLIRALHLLHQQGERVGLVIAGRDGWGWVDPLAAPELAYLQPLVRIYRNVPDADLPELYRRARVFAYPSLYEGFGLPLVEAMASGTPVVTSNRSSLPEVAGDAALLVDPESPEDIAAKLLRVLREPRTRARLVAAGLARCQQLSWRRTAERTLAVYRQVVAAECQ
jgi:glycosyltransferase involved in cell wall biosynthesis